MGGSILEHAQFMCSPRCIIGYFLQPQLDDAHAAGVTCLAPAALAVGTSGPLSCGVVRCLPQDGVCVCSCACPSSRSCEVFLRFFECGHKKPIRFGSTSPAERRER